MRQRADRWIAFGPSCSFAPPNPTITVTHPLTQRHEPKRQANSADYYESAASQIGQRRSHLTAKQFFTMACELIHHQDSGGSTRRLFLPCGMNQHNAKENHTRGHCNFFKQPLQCHWHLLVIYQTPEFEWPKSAPP